MSFRVAPTTCCAPSKHSASSGTVKSCTRARDARPTPRRIATLTDAKRIFACSCSRKDLAGVEDEAQGYPGTCRSGPDEVRTHRAALSRERPAYPLRRSVPRATALRSRPVRRCGRAASRWHRELSAGGGGRRRIPGCDARGARRGSAHQHALANRPAGSACIADAYLRSPATAAGTGWRQTIESRSGSPASTQLRRPKLLTSTLTHLSQAPPPDLAHSSIKDVWNWALEHWNPQALAGKTEVPPVRSGRQRSRIERRKLWGARRCTKVGPTRRMKA